MPTSTRRLIPLALALAAVSVSCGDREAVVPPIATPHVTLNKDRVAIGSPITIRYAFDVAPDAKINGDYWVFVHVLDTDGEKLWQDDHQPPIPTSSWKPGQHVEYERRIFVPNYPYIGHATMRIGLYLPSSGERLPLSATEIVRREYEVARFELLPQSENIFLIYKDGWYAAEVDSNNPTQEWQWTRNNATISFRNPKQDSTFYLEYDARPDLFDKPQEVTVRIGETVIGSFPADSRTPELVTMPVSAEQLGTADQVELALAVDRTFVPGETDSRELGIRVFHAFVEPQEP